MSAEVKKIEEMKEKEREKEKETEHKEDKRQQDDELEKDVDEVKEEPKKSLEKRIKEQWQLILKIVELVLCALCLSFFFEPAQKSANIAKHHLEQVGLIFLAFNGYLLINSVFVVSRCLKDRIPYRISALFSVIAAVLFFVAAILLIVDRKNKFQNTTWEPHMYLASMLSASTVLCFINFVIFTVDGVYTYISKQDF